MSGEEYEILKEIQKELALLRQNITENKDVLKSKTPQELKEIKKLSKEIKQNLSSVKNKLDPPIVEQ